MFAVDKRNGKDDHRSVRYRLRGLQADGDHGAEGSTALRWQTVEVCRSLLLRYYRSHNDRYVRPLFVSCVDRAFYLSLGEISCVNGVVYCIVILCRLRPFDAAHDRRQTVHNGVRTGRHSLRPRHVPEYR